MFIINFDYAQQESFIDNIQLEINYCKIMWEFEKNGIAL